MEAEPGRRVEINEKSVSEERPSSRKREAASLRSLGEAKGKTHRVNACW